MSKQYPGGLITKTPPTPSGPYETSTAAGIWTLNQVAYWTKQGLWPTPGNIAPDPYFNYVTMLLHGNGSASGTTNVLPFNSDASTNAFNLAINGDARSNNFNPYQAGYYSNYFDGSGDYLTGTSPNLSGTWTVELWWFPTVFSGNQTIISFNNGAGPGINIWSNSSRQLSVDDGNTGQSAFTTTTFTANTWNHLAVVRNGTTTTGYINGVVAGSNSFTPSTTSAFSIGRFNGGSFQYVNGYISNARVVNGTAIYTSAFTPPTTPLTAISGTSLLTCQSNRFIDNSTNAYTVTKNGDTAIFPAQPFTLPSSVATYGSGYFDGTGDNLTTASNTAFAFGTGDFTIEFWAYKTANTPGNYDIAFGTGDAGTGNNGYFIELSSTRGFVFASNNAVVLSYAMNPNTSAWAHYAVTRSGSTLRLFVDGAVVTSTTYSTSLTSTVAVRVGGTGNDFFGYLADMRVVKGTAVYTTTYTLPTAPLTAISGTSLLTTQYNGAGNNSGFKDSSQNNFVVSRFGNTTQGTFTPFGSNWSNYFDGSGDYLSTPSSSGFAFGTGDFTVEAWINTNILTGEKGFIQTSATAGGLQTSYTDGVLGVIVAGAGSYTITANIGGTNVTGSVAITTGTWYHVAFTRSSGSVRLFINGALVGGPTTITANLTGTYACVGGYYSTGYLWSGYISNLRVVKGTAVYTAAFTPSTTPLTAISGTSLLTCADNRFIDDSTNNFTLTRNGDVSVQRFSPFAPTNAYSTSTISGSAYFDGTGDYLTVPSNIALSYGTGDFEISFWYYATSASGYFFDQRTTQPQVALAIYYDTGTIQVYINGSIPISGTEPSKNSWNYLTLSRVSGTTRLFVNGSQLGSNYTDSNNYGTLPMRVGCRYATITDIPYGGYITDFKVIKGSGVTSQTIPTSPTTSTANTSLLLNSTNAAIYDNSMINELETVGNAMVSTSIEKYGAGSMYFDGSADYLDSTGGIVNALGSGSWTIEFWVYFNALTGTNIIDYRSASVLSSTLAINYSSGMQLYVNNTTTAIQGSALSTGTWYHIAVCKSGNSTKMFVNGTQVGSTYTDTNTYVAGANRPRIGSGGDVAGNYFNGYIDDLRITRGYARYTANFTPPTSQFQDR